jgi:threonyl-tRNA synthetase
MEMEGETYVLRPMNCPHHMVIYGNDIHSYRDLPYRIAEVANDFRYEAAGACKGLERVRAMTQNDSHIFCRPDQVEEEFKNVVNLIMEVYKDFNVDVNKFQFRLSLRDKNSKTNKYFDDDEMWEKAESALRKVLTDMKLDFFEAKDEAAFYGPKLDVLVKPAVGPAVTIPTVQLDFLLPRNFELSYIDENGEKQTPVVIHRAILGSIDRFMAFLLEETKGVLPLWVAPVQLNIIPVNNEYHLEYAEKIKKELNGYRVELDSREEKLGYKLRESVMKKIPITLIIGQKEVDNKTVSYRCFGSEETTTVSLDEFKNYLKERIDTKK